MIDKTVLLFSHRELDATRESMLAQLAQSEDLDWEKVIRSARLQRTLLLLVHALDGASAGRLAVLPPDIARRLFAEAALYRRRLEVRLRELKYLLLELDKVGVRPIVLKGPALECTVYQNSRTRAFGDLDLLVPTIDLDAVEVVLQKAGYVQGEYDANQHSIVPAEKRYIAAREQAGRHLNKFLKQANDHSDLMFEVEVHGPNNDQTFLHRDIQSMIERAQAATIAGAPASVLCPLDNVVYLSAHLYKHIYDQTSSQYLGFAPLIDFCDLREVFNTYTNASWDELYTVASAFGCTNAVFFALTHTEELYPGTISNMLLSVHTNLSDDPASVVDDRWDFVGGSSFFLERQFRPLVDLDRLKCLKEAGIVGGQLMVYHTAIPARIDGDLADQCWQMQEFVELSGCTVPAGWQYFKTHTAYGRPPASDTDLSARFALCWSQDLLFIAVRVNDDILVRNQFFGFYQLQDCVQVLFEIPLGSGHVTNLLLVPQAADVIRPAVLRDGKVPVPGARIATRVISGGYTIEAALPFRSLGVRIADPFGFDIVIYDTDQPGHERKTVLAWSGGRNAMLNPLTFGRARLIRQEDDP